MVITNTTGDVVRTPTVQPEEWQPNESRDLPEALARALAASSHFTLTQDGEPQPPAQPTPVEAKPDPTPAPVDPSPFVAPQPTL